MGYQTNDPRWVDAPVDTKCGKCGAPIRKGARAYYFPEKEQVLCNTFHCGQTAWRKVEDEIRNTG